MNSLATSINSCTNNVGNVKIALASRCFTYADGLVGHLYMQRFGIRPAVNRNGRNPTSLHALMILTAISPRLAT